MVKHKSSIPKNLIIFCSFIFFDFFCSFIQEQDKHKLNQIAYREKLNSNNNDKH
jgi:hypothetical protein